MADKKRLLIAFAAIFIIIFGTVIGIVVGHILHSGQPYSGVASQETIKLQQAHLEILKENSTVEIAKSYLNVKFPDTTGDPSPAFSNDIFTKKIQSHLVVGYAPSFELGSITPQDIAAMSMVCYDGIDVGSLGQIINDQSLSLLSQSPVKNLISTAHNDNDKVLLTIFTASNQIIKSITAHPVKSASNLANELIPLLKNNDFDGVSIDIEGQYGKERSGFVNFMRHFRSDLLLQDKSALLLLDSYVDSAADPNNFYNIKDLYPLVNYVFIMGYDMNNSSTSSPNAPLVNENLGNSDVQSLLSYTEVVPASKLVLGVPFYGYEFTTRNQYPNSPTTGSNSYPTAITWSSILATKTRELWDPMSLTAWEKTKVGKHWDQTWFDNPISISLKTALASELHLAGVGVWALGMNGSDTQMLQALEGGTQPLKGAAVIGIKREVRRKSTHKK